MKYKNKVLESLAPSNTATGNDIIERLQAQLLTSALNGFNKGRETQLEDVYKVLYGLGFPKASEALKKFMERI